MKKLYIIHGWEGSPDEPLLKWIRGEAESLGFVVTVPEMPHADHPIIEEWVGTITALVKNPDPETYFIGHSIGCQAILRYLESVNEKIGGVIFIAPWVDLKLETEEEYAIAFPWIKTPIDIEKVKDKLGECTALFSDNDPYVLLEKNRQFFKDTLGCRVHVEHEKGHFTEDDGVRELPIITKLLSKFK